MRSSHGTLDVNKRGKGFRCMGGVLTGEDLVLAVSVEGQKMEAVRARRRVVELLFVARMPHHQLLSPKPNTHTLVRKRGKKQARGRKIKSTLKEGKGRAHLTAGELGGQKDDQRGEHAGRLFRVPVCLEEAPCSHTTLLLRYG